MTLNDRFDPFPVIDVSGDAYECGQLYGAQAAERVARTVAFYLGSFERKKLSLAEVRERAREYSSQIAAIDAELMRELEGIAAGAEQHVDDIVAVNCRTELLYGGMGGEVAATECTTIAVLPEATRDGGILIGKNWDWRNSQVDAVVVLRVRQTDRPAVVMVVEAGMVGRDGFNEDGIMVCGNLLVSTRDRGRVGVPVPILRRRIMHARHYYEAIDVLAHAPRGASGNYLIAHRDGVAIGLETTPDDLYPIYPERGLMTHSNHFQSLVAQVSGVTKYYTGDTLYRDFRARQLLEPHLGGITVDHIKHVLRDEFGAPRAICRTPHEYPGHDPTMTIASMVFDLKQNLLHVAPGQPTRSEYQAVGLSNGGKT